MIPAMKRRGYDPAFAAALVTAAGGMGVLIPPCLTMIVFGSLTNTSIGALFLAGWIVLLVASLRTPEFRTGWATEIERGRAQRPGPLAIAGWALYALYMIAVLITPIVILLGVVPDLEAALYYALVVLILLGAGWSLLGLVFAQRLPESA